jgi:hypothetical protein
MVYRLGTDRTECTVFNSSSTVACVRCGHYLATAVVWLLISMSLPSNWSTCHPEDVGSTFLRNFRVLLPDYMESHPRTVLFIATFVRISNPKLTSCSPQAITPQAQDGRHRIASRCGRFLPNTFHFIYPRLREPIAYMDITKENIYTTGGKGMGAQQPLIEVSRKYSNSSSTELVTSYSSSPSYLSKLDA